MLVIEIGGLERAVYFFAVVLCVIHMQGKDGTNTLAKDVRKQRTHSEKTDASPLSFPAGLQRSNRMSRTSHI